MKLASRLSGTKGYEHATSCKFHPTKDLNKIFSNERKNTDLVDGLCCFNGLL
jgi:hypothetical protein